MECGVFRRFGILFLACLAAGCRGEAPEAPRPAPWFVDVTDEVGLDFVHDAGPLPEDGAFFMPQSIGSGAALFDFDGDGRLDIYLLNNGGPKGRPNQLFRQMPGGTFENVSKGSGLDFSGYCMGVAIGDVNNDGKPDVLVTMYRGIKLFLNNGDGTFTDVTEAAGLDSPFWGTSAAFFDFNGDGWLDLVVVNYVDYDPTKKCASTGGAPDYCSPGQFGGSVVKLFRNCGRPGTPRFEDVTLRSGLGRAPGPGLGVVCLDFDGDGLPDVLVANDAQPNRLWINRGDGTFVDEAVLRGIARNKLGQAQANMGVAVGDVNGDGLPDVFVTHLTEETNTLWVQGPGGLFRDRTAESGLARPSWRGTGWGAVLADFDHDGALDLALVNGRVSRGKAASGLRGHWAHYSERNQLFAGDGRGGFSDRSEANDPFCGAPGPYRGLAVGDVDGDGALDLLVTAVGGRARLYRNVAPGRGHWLLARALDGKRDAHGARLTVRAGGRKWVGWESPNQSYLCSNDPRAHFGLGAAGRVDEIEVLWPGGGRECFPGGPADRVVTLRKGRGEKVGKGGGR